MKILPLKKYKCFNCGSQNTKSYLKKREESGYRGTMIIEYIKVICYDCKSEGHLSI